LQSLLQSKIGSSRASQIISQLGTSTTYSNLLKFYASSGMTSTEFAKVYNDITTSANKYSTGLVNVNTAGAPVLEALFEGLGVSETVAESAAQTLIAYRQQHSDNLGSITWIMDALGSSHTVIQDLESASREYLTTRSYQFTADVAAVGPFGRGYRRVKFVFDITEGTPKVIYRQDLGRLGWALGEKVRTAWVTKQTQ
jgi:type II secretory pathway component PulK